jgi:hypothetical protein
MYTIYRMNADELNADLIDSLKTLFKHRHIEIRVHETDDTAEWEERRSLFARYGAGCLCNLNSIASL